MSAEAPTGLVPGIIRELESAAGARKCHRCGCFRGALEQFQTALPELPPEARERLVPVLEHGSAQLVTSEYDCIGCPVCWPANALNLGAEAFPGTAVGAGESCPTDVPDATPGWPPYPGNYRVVDAAGDIAVCVLTSESLIAPLASLAPARVGIIGAVYTENLGLERVISNVLANPNLTCLLLCGADSQQRIGHLPGQALMSLMDNGLDAHARIIGAEGRRPVLKNIPAELVDRFRREVAVVDLIGQADVAELAQAIRQLPRRPPRTATLNLRFGVAAIVARPPERLVLDPKGYFVLFPDRARGLVVVEHYQNSGVLTHMFEGDRSDHLFTTILEHDVVSRLDHAAYLGQELARAVHALQTGEPYVQDRAPAPPCDHACGCHATGADTKGGKSCG